MSDIIKLLPDSVANQIAAGEVIQRPASVIKELIENAVDAGATDIQVIIKDAGRTLIQVIDNGKGMTETDARMAFERHATSKISQADDLFSLHTMGFRGEALPSICAVSQVELRTRTRDDDMGVRLCINASKVESQEPCVCECGANFMVKNLFFNVPARRKFLKSDSVELANIMREFERLALVNNNIRLSIDTGNRKITLMPGNFKQRIHDIWKNNLNMQLIPVNIDTLLVRISGFVSRPENARRRNPLQFFIVNGRNMKHPYFHKAILNCFESLIPSGTQPCYFLRFDVDPSTIDVNIHPTKNEIKFENEKEIWPLLAGAVRASLGSNSAVPSIDFTAEVLPASALPPGVIPEKPRLDMPEDYNPFKIAGNNPAIERDKGYSEGKPKRIGTAWRPTRPTAGWEELYSGFMNRKGEEISDFKESADSSVLPDIPEDHQSLYLQLALKYILTPTREGLMIIDQHRAHLKVLYEQFLSSTSGASHSSQRIMFAETLHLDPAQQLAIEGIEDELKRVGFMLRQEKGGAWIIEGVPAELSKVNPADVILSILESISDDTENYGAEESPEIQARRKTALVMARCAAITRGVRLSESEMEELVGRLMALPDPAVTPYGRPVYKVISGESIESWF